MWAIGNGPSVGARDGSILGAPIILIIVCRVSFKKCPVVGAKKCRVVGAHAGEVVGYVGRVGEDPS